MRPLYLLLTLVLTVSSLHAQSTTWTIDDVLNQESLSQVAISPDGKKIVWVKRYPDKKADRMLSDIYLTLLEEKGKDGLPETLRLTYTGDNSSPLWSPDGRWIAFASSRPIKEGGKEEKKGRQIWLLDTRGGEPHVLTRLENGFNRFRWLDNETLLFTAREKKTTYEKQLEKKKDDAHVVEDSTLFWAVRLFTLNVRSRKIKRLTTNDYRITEFAPDPQGRYVVYSLQTSPITADARHQPLQYLLDLQSGKTQEIFAVRYFDPENFIWRRDGKGFYATDDVSSDPANEGAGKTVLYYFDVETMRYEEVPLNWDWGVGFGGYTVTENGVHVQLAAGPRMKPRFYRHQENNWTSVDVADYRLRHSTSLTVGPDGHTMVFVYSRADTLPQYLVGHYENGMLKRVRPFVRLNRYLEKKPIPRAEVVYWVGAEGDTVNGILYYPLNYRKGKRYPLITVIHGGPTGADLDAWRLGWTVYAPIWAEKGAFVFRPNYHGSGNHGQEWAESIKERYYELEIPDIVSGIQYLIDRGLVDPDSLGVMGWSNGAILTIGLQVEHPEMFKVAAPGAGDVNWISDYGNCAFGVRFDNYYFGGPPWERLEHYIEKSPFFRLNRVITPTLIHFGTEDTSVPTEQGWEHYRAMQQMEKAPVRFLLYPEEPHGFRRLSHQRRKMEEDINWFDYYLFGKKTWQETLEARAVPEDAPLARLERRRAIARYRGHYGLISDGILIPETITVGDTLQIGRFEVTRAQFRAFRKEYPVPPGTENYPANTISFADAQAYVQWLSARTGYTYRLPTEEELKALRKLAGSSENNLTYWAGYTPTPDEYEVLKRKLARWTAEDLLMPVGSRPPGNARQADAPLIFDVDGNVAEWASNGKPINLSAVTYRDEHAERQPEPPPSFIGFRVVLVRR